VPLDSEAEVICIVRPLADPRAKSEIVVLDRASRNFMHLLSSEGRRQSDRHLTSLNVPQRPARPARRSAPLESADGWRPHVPR
jgi:hypothetical protein